MYCGFSITTITYKFWGSIPQLSNMKYTDSEVETVCDILWESTLEIEDWIWNPQEKLRKAKLFRKFKMELLIKRAMCK